MLHAITQLKQSLNATLHDFSRTHCNTTYDQSARTFHVVDIGWWWCEAAVCENLTVMGRWRCQTNKIIRNSFGTFVALIFPCQVNLPFKVLRRQVGGQGTSFSGHGGHRTVHCDACVYRIHKCNCTGQLAFLAIWCRHLHKSKTSGCSRNSTAAKLWVNQI